MTPLATDLNQEKNYFEDLKIWRFERMIHLWMVQNLCDI